jgi:caffeoyl-CoA O-methyltransferase
MRIGILWTKILSLGLGIFLIAAAEPPAPAKNQSALDERVEKFLAKMKNRWHDLNVPEEDGKILYDLVVKNGYKKALEVGTSTGHSAIWIAWALAKTGGKLITVEIDESVHRKALANFREAGLNEYIDARLADAHELVQELPGPFDFVFIDADKEYYPNYARVLAPKIAPGGCLTAHNVHDPGPLPRGHYESGTAEFFRYMKSLPEFQTYIHPQSRRGVAVSYKQRKP